MNDKQTTSPFGIIPENKVSFSVLTCLHNVFLKFSIKRSTKLKKKKKTEKIKVGFYFKQWDTSELTLKTNFESQFSINFHSFSRTQEKKKQNLKNNTKRPTLLVILSI